MIREIKFDFEESIKVKKLTAEKLSSEIAKAVEIIIDCYKQGGKMVLCGNGGSAADAEHLAAEMVGRFGKERRPLPALALTTNTSILTCLGNDYGYEKVFTRQVEVMAESRDVLIAISTSGNSENVNAAVRLAREKGVKTIGLIGKGGGEMATLVDIALVVPSDETPRIQEVHITIGHILCKLVEEQLI